MYKINKFEGEIYQKLNKILDSYNQEQNSLINLAACISYPFTEVLKIQSFPLATLPTEGAVEKRFFPHCTSLDNIEVYSEELCLQLFDLNPGDYRVNVQPHSGTQANQIVYNCVLERDDYILSLSPKDGGHISHTYTGKGTVKYYHLDHNLNIDYIEL
ncbi:TPA: glycine hydroxymethyltransferase, partial [Streptococcus suis]|nr:glycine hydroxymethyltransferase [Streptococcus suis]